MPQRLAARHARHSAGAKLPWVLSQPDPGTSDASYFRWTVSPLAGGGQPAALAEAMHAGRIQTKHELLKLMRVINGHYLVPITPSGSRSFVHG